MKEITRIHVAKVSYDIEISAKKELEKYLHALESYGTDNEVINDIEIRMTELLSERGIKKGDVIALADIDAMKMQLGAPNEIMGEGDMAIGDVPEMTTKKLFRDTDTPVLGGVLSGIAYFFGVNPLWTRLLFIVLALASFGTAILVYLVLWIAVPPAKTVADKLQMRGRSVTAQSIREFNDNDAAKSAQSSGVSGRRVVTIIAGVVASLGALSAIMITIAAIFGVLADKSFEFLNQDVSGFFVAAFILMVISGVLLAVLCSLGAFVAFAQKVTKRIAITMVAVVVLGMSTFITAIGLAHYGTLRHETAVRSLTTETNITLPATATSIRALQINAKNVKTTYNVTSDTPSATLKSLSNEDGKVSASIDGQTLRLSAENFKTDGCKAPWCHDVQPEIIINGPALDAIQQSDQNNVEYVASNQEKLAIKTGMDGYFVISSGVINEVSVTAAENSTIHLEDASIVNINTNIAHAAVLNAGVVEHFTLTSPKACPGDRNKAIIDIQQITSGIMKINGDETRSVTTKSACANVIINNEDER